MSDSAIVFGASGALGSAIAELLDREGVSVMRATRSTTCPEDWISTASDEWVAGLARKPVNRVIFAQGANAAGDLMSTSSDDLAHLIDANVLTVARWLKDLVEGGSLSSRARVCIVGSVWAQLARPNKFAYVVSKSAVSGLVRSLAADLGDKDIAVNAVLPGVVDTPMTRAFLDADAVDRIASETPLRSLVTPDDVAEVCAWLTSSQAAGISGQSLVVDRGWSVTRHV